MKRRQFIQSTFIGLGLLATGVTIGRKTTLIPQTHASEGKFEVEKTAEQWHKILSEEQFSVLREAATERPFTSVLLNEHREGDFICAACDLPVYGSYSKFDSGTGWPSFYEPLEKGIGTKADNTWFSKRTEVHCARCGGHLGHVFNDGPKPTGMRHCINGVALKFSAKV
jgi:peptide-methionine (R)-S-oxide reductase